MRLSGEWIRRVRGNVNNVSPNWRQGHFSTPHHLLWFKFYSEIRLLLSSSSPTYWHEYTFSGKFPLGRKERKKETELTIPKKPSMLEFKRLFTFSSRSQSDTFPVHRLFPQPSLLPATVTAKKQVLITFKFSLRKKTVEFLPASAW